MQVFIKALLLSLQLLSNIDKIYDKNVGNLFHTKISCIINTYVLEYVKLNLP